MTVMLYRHAGAVIALLSATLIAACTGSTSQTSVERAARAKSLPNAPYSNLVIVAITERGATAREFEEELVKELSKYGVSAIGYHRAASRADVREDVVREVVENRNADAIVIATARLVNAERKQKGGRTDVQSEVKGGSLVEFFRYDYQEYTSPVSADYRLSVQFNTDMFDTDTEDRIYTLESRTDFAETSSEIIVNESREIARRLRKDKMVR